jgi:serine/threonine-protein kinase
MSMQPATQIKHYVIKDLISRGGMGMVWRAWDLNRKEFVAIKVIASDLVVDPNFKYRFLDEVRRHARLNHPNIVPVLDVFELHGENCFVMQLIEGMSLADLLEHQEKRRLTPEEAIPIVEDILNALNYAHQQGIIHRDVKPSNVLLDKNRRAHLIDFGIALAVGEQRRTRAGQILGTSFYMSPEQIARPREIDHRSDVYSVGCVFYEMLTGRPPFLPDPGSTGDTDFAIKQAHVTKAPLPPRQRVATIPADLDRLIMWALEKDPAKRLPGCGEFLRLLLKRATSTEKRTELVKRILRISLIYLLVLALVYIMIWAISKLF